MRRDTIRKLYRDAIVQVFGCGDSELDSDLLRAVKSDVHYSDRAPGQWTGEGSILEIYCEGGIPNATDVNDFSCYAAEVGCNPSELVSYNTDKWDMIDGLVNLMLEAMGRYERYYHEPYNGAVVGVWRR